MSLYDRREAQLSHDRPGFKPLEPVDWFVEDPLLPADATQHSGRFMYRATTGLLRSDGATWVPVALARKLFVPAADSLVGATAGWVVTGADDGLARLPASQTSSTLIVPLKGLYEGDTITAVRAIGQVESAGANVTLVMSVRKATAVAADFTDAELGAASPSAFTADTLLSAAVLEVAALTEVLTDVESLYVRLTGTTAAATDVAIAGFQVDVLAGLA